MTKKIFSFLLAMVVLVGFNGMTASKVSADTFPIGCSSAFGYSTTSGSPCNGTMVASQYLPGCLSAVGYSATSGTPCNGTNVAAQYPNGSFSTGVMFPTGCTSALGYSITSGAPCNGTSFATNAFINGCSTALGYSTVNGIPCSGGSSALSFLAGCTAVTGYSTITGAPCNGTSFVTPVTPVVVNPGTPGLPMTGASGNLPANALALALSGLVVALGVVYVARRSATAK